VIWLFVSLQGVIYLGSLVAFRRSSGKFANRFLRISAPIVVASTAFPVVTFLYRLAPVWAQRMPAAILGLIGASALIGWWARACRRFPLSPLTAIAGLTTLTLVIDAAFGGWLQHVSLLGYTPITAARFYGMGNMGFAILGASALMLAGSWVDTAPVRRDGLVAAGCLLWVVTLVEMLPDAGADFGAAVVFVPVFILVMIAWSGIRISRGRAVLCALAIVVAVAVAVVADLKLSGGTHLGRFASSDGGGIWDVVLRKLQTNLRVMRITTWTWMVPIIVAFIFGSFLAGGGSSRWFGDNRVWRTTFVALLGFGVLGGLLNDSGVVIPALVLVYVGALLFMVQDRHAFSPPKVTIPEGVEQPLDAGLAPSRLISATAPDQSA
jgi:hypothetical protein